MGKNIIFYHAYCLINFCKVCHLFFYYYIIMKIILFKVHAWLKHQLYELMSDNNGDSSPSYSWNKEKIEKKEFLYQTENQTLANFFFINLIT